MSRYLLPVYLLVLAAFLAFLNVRTRSSWFAKKITYWGMWAAVIGSAVSALAAYR